MRVVRFILVIYSALAWLLAGRQAFALPVLSWKSAPQPTIRDTLEQQDILDVARRVFKIKVRSEVDTVKDRLRFSVIPFAGYTLSTGFAVGLSGVLSFYNNRGPTAKESVINFQALYDSRQQKTFISQSNIYTESERYRFINDLRVSKFPTITYGLGNNSPNARADSLIYNYIRFYHTTLKRVAINLYLGGGYCLDYFFNISGFSESISAVYAAYPYATNVSRTIASGFNLSLLYDGRLNPLNPQGGTYLSAFYRNNLTVLGSDSRWSSLQIDARKYLSFGQKGKSILAFWGYAWLTLDGNQPYFNLPSTGNDMYNGIGRGYQIDRYRGRNLLYVEVEYRFGITKNGLIGAVVFANSQSYVRRLESGIRKIIPAGGLGLRIKVNKYTNTNLAIDYAVGLNGSRGLFVNLGEIF